MKRIDGGGPQDGDTPLDLSPLSPTADAAEWEGLVKGILLASEVELGRRRRGARITAPGLLAALAGWTRPILSAAVLVILVSTGLLQLVPGGSPGGGEEEELVLAELLGLPSTVATWLDEERSPSGRDLFLALEEGEGWR